MNLQQILTDILATISALGWLAPLAFIAIYTLATIGFVPGSLLTLGAGILFGVIWGSVYVLIGATLGAIGAFLLGRYLVRGWVSSKIAQSPKFQGIDRAVAQEGLKIVLLTRLSPLFPFNLLNYAFGITAVSLKDYVIGSVGMIPGTVLYVYVGSLGGNLAQLGSKIEPNPLLQWTIRTIGFAATLAVTLYITRLAQRELAKELES
ncbi:MAG: TVP38/TMEM64 family protein [Cyanobacteria bacterium M5B4]|nr:MAG: TVP38/TMEM64 family protein [Cyanobacteria bacterium M5B4]